jgi:predicted MPP superfamily phosphohydrolase
LFVVFSWSIGLFLSWVLYRWAVDSFPALRHRRPWVAATLGTIWLGPAILRWIVISWHVGGTPYSLMLLVWMTTALTALPLGVLRALGWAIPWAVARMRRAEGASSPPAARETRRTGAALEPAPLTRRQIVEGTSGLALLGATGTTLGWGAVCGRHAFELSEVAVRVRGLPRALDGYVIAQISDIHTGLYVGDRELDEGFARVREARADLLVVTGDIVDFDDRYAPLIARKLASVAPRDGVTAILGNHDHYAGPDAIADALRATGVDLLVNAGKVVRARDGGGFALLGVDDLHAAKLGLPGPRLDRALAGVPADIPRILLSHQPHTVDQWPGQVALQLSGHTHGGQINPGFRPAGLFLKYVAGLYEVNGTTLYVNRGFGTVGPPTRVGAPPEITRIVLVAS